MFITVSQYDVSVVPSIKKFKYWRMSFYNILELTLLFLSYFAVKASQELMNLSLIFHPKLREELGDIQCQMKENEKVLVQKVEAKIADLQKMFAVEEENSLKNVASGGEFKEISPEFLSYNDMNAVSLSSTVRIEDEMTTETLNFDLEVVNAPTNVDQSTPTSNLDEVTAPESLVKNDGSLLKTSDKEMDREKVKPMSQNSNFSKEIMRSVHEVEATDFSLNFRMSRDGDADQRMEMMQECEEQNMEMTRSDDVYMNIQQKHVGQILEVSHYDAGEDPTNVEIQDVNQYPQIPERDNSTNLTNGQDISGDMDVHQQDDFGQNMDMSKNFICEEADEANMQQHCQEIRNMAPSNLDSNETEHDISPGNNTENEKSQPQMADHELAENSTERGDTSSKTLPQNEGMDESFTK